MSNPSKYVSRSVRTAYIASVIGLTLVLMFFGLLAWGLLKANEFTTMVRETTEVDVFMLDRAPEADKIRLEKALMEMPFVKSADKISSKEALEVISTKDDGLEEIAEFAEEDAIPPSILIKVKADYVNLDTLERYEAYIEKNFSDVVLDVHFKKSQVEALDQSTKKPVYFVLIITALLLVIAVALINNTIRLAIYSNRFSLKTMTLVGAKSGYIRRPYLLNSVIQGLISGILALGLLVAFVYVLTELDIIHISTVQLIGGKLFLYIFGILTALGIVISFVSTFFALRKYIRIKTDNLY